jgi:hypothetical protein
MFELRMGASRNAICESAPAMRPRRTASGLAMLDGEDIGEKVCGEDGDILYVDPWAYKKACCRK